MLWVFLAKLAAALLDVLEADQERISVMPQALRVVVDDPVDFWQALLDFQYLIDLFLILCEHDGGIGMINHILQFSTDGVLIERYRSPSHDLGRHHGPIDLRPVITQDGELIVGLESQGHQSERQVSHFLLVLRPGPLLPDALFLLPDCHLPWALTRVPHEKLRKRPFSHHHLLLTPATLHLP